MPTELKPPEPWQKEDLDYLTKRVIFDDENTANWSEMGCKKTTTGLWLIQQAVSKIEHPAVIIVTTRSGKGTFFDFAPSILEGWTILNVNSQSIEVLMEGELVKIPGLDHVPEQFGMPTLVVTHYHVFSRSNYGQWETDPETGDPLENEEGGLVMKKGTQADFITQRRWDFAWLDEAHRIKGRDTKWTVVLKRLKATRRHVSTGTGFINRPHEIWSPLNFLDKKRFPSFWAFYDEFCDVDDESGYTRVVGVKPEKKDLFRKIVREYGPRRTLTEVMPHIKEPLWQPREIELNPIQRKMYDQIKNDLYMLDQKGEPVYAANVLSLLQRLRAICVATPEVVEDYFDVTQDRRVQKITLVEPSSKLDCLMDDVIQGLEWDEDARQPVVVFSNFVPPLKMLQARFNKANEAALEMGLEPEYPYLWMKESDSDEERFNKWNKLFPSLEYRVFMSTLKVGSESVNLTPARHVVFLDRDWSPLSNMQGIGRVRRPGQEGQPIVININAIDTVDTYIKDVNDIKEGWFKEIFGN